MNYITEIVATLSQSVRKTSQTFCVTAKARQEHKRTSAFVMGKLGEASQYNAG